jgi:hypothetical protein
MNKVYRNSTIRKVEIKTIASLMIINADVIIRSYRGE